MFTINTRIVTKNTIIDTSDEKLHKIENITAVINAILSDEQVNEEDIVTIEIYVSTGEGFKT